MSCGPQHLVQNSLFFSSLKTVTYEPGRMIGPLSKLQNEFGNNQNVSCMCCMVIENLNHHLNLLTVQHKLLFIYNLEQWVCVPIICLFFWVIHATISCFAQNVITCGLFILRASLWYSFIHRRQPYCKHRWWVTLSLPDKCLVSLWQPQGVQANLCWLCLVKAD